VELRRPTLEDIFVGIVTGGGEEAARLRAAVADAPHAGNAGGHV